MKAAENKFLELLAERIRQNRHVSEKRYRHVGGGTSGTLRRDMRDI
jgi:hypothetical protein